MRTVPTQVLALSALASFVRAGPCGYSITCVNPGTTYAPCSPENAAEFELVAPLLQQCDDVTYYFNRGVWSTADRQLHCDVNSPCGSLVPYIVNTNAEGRLCAPYERFAYVLVTFRDYCRNEPVYQLPGDNGLLASLKSNNRTRKPTPAPTRPEGAEAPEIIPNSEAPTPTPASTSVSTTTQKPDSKSTDANSKTSSDARSMDSFISKALVALTVAVAGAVMA